MSDWVSSGHPFFFVPNLIPEKIKSKLRFSKTSLLVCKKPLEAHYIAALLVRNCMEEEDFSNKYLTHEINRKKIYALINFSETLDNFTDWLAVEYITRWLNKEFLDKEGERFLDYLLTKYGLNYLDWCYKSPWVKRQIASRRSPQAAFLFEDLEEKKLAQWKSMARLSFVNRNKILQLELLA